MLCFGEMAQSNNFRVSLLADQTSSHRQVFECICSGFRLIESHVVHFGTPLKMLFGDSFGSRSTTEELKNARFLLKNVSTGPRLAA